MKQNETIHIDLELPCRTACAFVNYVYYDEYGGAKMGVRQISTKDIESGKSELVEERETKNESN